jgi:hypothetical protein
VVSLAVGDFEYDLQRLYDGCTVTFHGVHGMEEVDNKIFRISKLTKNTFQVVLYLLPDLVKICARLEIPDCLVSFNTA